MSTEPPAGASSPSRPLPARTLYLIAVAAPALGWIAARLLPAFAPAPFLPPALAVVLVARVGGTGPGILAALVAALGGAWAAPERFLPPGVDDAARTAVLLALALIVGPLASRTRRLAETARFSGEEHAAAAARVVALERDGAALAAALERARRAPSPRDPEPPLPDPVAPADPADPEGASTPGRDDDPLDHIPTVPRRRARWRPKPRPPEEGEGLT